MSSYEDKIKLFGMSQIFTERELDKLEEKLEIDLERKNTDDKDEVYYPQFEVSFRKEAAEMSKHYELFYCLENSIRKLIMEVLESECGNNWWENCVSNSIKENVKNLMKKEQESGITLRSDLEIDFTTLGELSTIVKENWEYFDSIFSNKKAFTRIMASLNLLRGPIAHCKPFAKDEIIRLQLTVKDWFRLME